MPRCAQAGQPTRALGLGLPHASHGAMTQGRVAGSRPLVRRAACRSGNGPCGKSTALAYRVCVTRVARRGWQHCTRPERDSSPVDLFLFCFAVVVFSGVDILRSERTALSAQCRGVAPCVWISAVIPPAVALPALCSPPPLASLASPSHPLQNPCSVRVP